VNWARIHSRRRSRTQEKGKGRSASTEHIKRPMPRWKRQECLSPGQNEFLNHAKGARNIHKVRRAQQEAKARSTRPWGPGKPLCQVYEIAGWGCTSPAGDENNIHELMDGLRRVGNVEGLSDKSRPPPLTGLHHSPADMKRRDSISAPWSLETGRKSQEVGKNLQKFAGTTEPATSKMGGEVIGFLEKQGTQVVALREEGNIPKRLTIPLGVRFSPKDRRLGAARKEDRGGRVALLSCSGWEWRTTGSGDGRAWCIKMQGAPQRPRCSKSSVVKAQVSRAVELGLVPTEPRSERGSCNERGSITLLASRKSRRKDKNFK